MIAVPRDRVDAPRSLAYRAAARARAAVNRFFGRPAEERRQERHAFDAGIYAAADVRAALLELFEGKCAFCEALLGSSAGLLVEHLRPPQGAVALDGSTAQDHYAWLAYSWPNLYASCLSCSSLRGARFPVAGERAPFGTRYAALARAEEPLLLDPCADQPEQHLVYFEDGRVGSDTARGRTTCDAFALNRRDLLERRRATYAELEAALDEQPADAEPPAVPGDAEFAGLRRQLVKERIVQRGLPEPQDVRVVAPADKSAMHQDLVAHQRTLDAASVADDAAREDYFAHARLVERVEIRNFRVIEQLSLDLGSPAPYGDAPWTMLLGENAVGKSTVLQAITLALLDPAARDRLGLDAASFVRRGAQEASVSVTLTGSTAPIRLTARADSPTFEGESTQRVLVLGYGATRLLPTAGHPAPAGETYARVENLFDPFVPIGDTTSWLLGLPDARFDEVAAALRQLLLLEDGELLVRDPAAAVVEVERDGDRVPLEQLSAGYQSVIALATDVIKVLMALWDTVPAAEAIVVVDELGAHLHPRWRMRIVASLRAVFPRAQFLVSTHDPLCLRGIRDGEAVVLRRDAEGRIVLLDDLPPTDGMRVDQLLASELFGLGSTIDPAVDLLFADYYRLKAKRRHSRAEVARLGRLHEQLDGRKLLGVTRRERLALDAADEFLAREDDAARAGRRIELQDETRERIAALWSEADA